MATGALSLMIAVSGLSHAQTSKEKAGAEDAKAGAAKAAQCFTCHGTNGISKMPVTPNLAGQNHDYLVKALKDYKTGARKNDLMATMVRNLSDADMDQVAAYYSHIPITVKAPKSK
jgi:cytochrome c553